MTTTYQAIVTREDGWWMVHVPAINGLTQARRYGEVAKMARELIGVTLDVEASSVTVELAVKDVEGVAVQESVHEIAAQRDLAASLEAQATAKACALARSLAAHDVPLRDIGALLGVSHQRAHQLIAA